MSSNEDQQLAFEAWADEHGLCLDLLFASTDGVPDNPYLDPATKMAFGAWMTATALSRNYTADAEVAPQSMTFTNGRRVWRDGASLATEVTIAARRPRRGSGGKK